MIDEENAKTYEEFYNENINNGFNDLIEREYNPKVSEVRNETIKNNARFDDMGINKLEDDTDYSKFDDFVKKNEDYMNMMNNTSLEDKEKIINNAKERLLNKLDTPQSNKGKLIKAPDGYAIELDNGEIIYTDKNHNIMQRAIEKENRMKQKEHEKNQKLLQDEYNALLKRQEDEMKERERIKEEEERLKRERMNNVGKFISGAIGGIGINSLMNRR